MTLWLWCFTKEKAETNGKCPGQKQREVSNYLLVVVQLVKDDESNIVM